jgi:hypothetical protein
MNNLYDDQINVDQESSLSSLHIKRNWVYFLATILLTFFLITLFGVRDNIQKVIGSLVSLFFIFRLRWGFVKLSWRQSLEASDAFLKYDGLYKYILCHVTILSMVIVSLGLFALYAVGIASLIEVYHLDAYDILIGIVAGTPAVLLLLYIMFTYFALSIFTAYVSIDSDEDVSLYNLLRRAYRLSKGFKGQLLFIYVLSSIALTIVQYSYATLFVQIIAWLGIIFMLSMFEANIYLSAQKKYNKQ